METDSTIRTISHCWVLMAETKKSSGVAVTHFQGESFGTTDDMSAEGIQAKLSLSIKTHASLVTKTASGAAIWGSTVDAPFRIMTHFELVHSIGGQNHVILRRVSIDEDRAHTRSPGGTSWTVSIKCVSGEVGLDHEGRETIPDLYLEVVYEVWIGRNRVPVGRVNLHLRGDGRAGYESQWEGTETAEAVKSENIVVTKGDPDLARNTNKSLIGNRWLLDVGSEREKEIRRKIVEERKATILKDVTRRSPKRRPTGKSRDKDSPAQSRNSPKKLSRVSRLLGFGGAKVDDLIDVESLEQPKRKSRSTVVSGKDRRPGSAADGEKSRNEAQRGPKEPTRRKSITVPRSSSADTIAVGDSDEESAKQDRELRRQWKRTMRTKETRKKETRKKETRTTRKGEKADS